jgi:hypothetical protein
MARLISPLEGADELAPVGLSLEITYLRFQHGWVYYELLVMFGDAPLLNGPVLKASRQSPEVAPGAVTACEDESCSLLPAMRRFVETGCPEEWTPTDPDVTLRMGMAEGADGPHVSLLLEIDQYQWLGVTAYGGSMISVGFDCSFSAFNQFYRDLRAEFVVFRTVNEVTEYNTARGFRRPEHEWF